MFTKSAKFYDALFHFKDYKNEAYKLNEIIHSYKHDALTLLDVACGTGKHLQYLSEFISAEGIDYSKELLDIAGERCPGVIFHQGDMTGFDLKKKYDVITCLFSSIGYVRTAENLFKAVSCFSEHLNSNGLLIIEPWFSPQTYWNDRLTANFYDGPDLKIAWMYKSGSKDNVSVVDIHYLTATPDEISNFTEHHEIGLFTNEEYEDSFKRAGFDVRYDKEGLCGRGMYIGVKS